MSSVSDLVQNIGAGGVPPEIAESIVGRIAVVMTAFHAHWTWAHEGLKYQGMHRSSFTNPVPMQYNNHMPAGLGSRREHTPSAVPQLYPAPATALHGTVQAPCPTVITNLVIALVAENVAPFCHTGNYTSAVRHGLISSQHPRWSRAPAGRAYAQP